MLLWLPKILLRGRAGGECHVVTCHVQDVKRLEGTVAATWDRFHAAPHERLDLLAVQMVASGRRAEDFIPRHIALLSDRLSLGLDGISLSTSLRYGTSGSEEMECGKTLGFSGMRSRMPAPKLDGFGVSSLVSLLLWDPHNADASSPQFVLQVFGASALAMASGHGRYATEAAAGPLDAETNLTQVQQARVREYREKYLLFDDADFAYAFSSLEEAKLAGGDFLAAAWAKVRAQEDEKLILAAAAAAAAAVENLRAQPSSGELQLRHLQASCHQAATQRQSA
eukprot:s2435_g8.t1